MFNRTIFAGALAALAITAATPAAAQAKTATVDYADLDLTTKAGRDTLETRLARGVREVCGSRPDSRLLSAMNAYRECIATARASYEDQVRVAIANANGRRVVVLSSDVRFPA